VCKHIRRQIRLLKLLWQFVLFLRCKFLQSKTDMFQSPGSKFLQEHIRKQAILSSYA
jgi:hypothetical protein